MFLKENVFLAIAGLRANKIRAFLTMLGIIIGIGSVIAIVSIGQAVTNYVSDTMSSFGANNLYIYVAPREDDSFTSQMSGRSTQKIDDSDLLTLDQVNAMQEKYSSEIKDIALFDEKGAGKVEDGHLYANVTVYGASAGFADVENITMLKGRFLQQRDIDGNRQVAVVSDKLVSNMFRNNENPLGKTIDLSMTSGEDATYTIVGVYKYERTGMGGGGTSDKDISTNLMIPVSVAKETSDNQNYAEAEIKLNSTVDTEAFTQKLKTYMEHLYANNAKYTCSVYNEENMISQVTSMMSTLSIAIAAIAAIALIVGGIGVMNIMLVSVTERTREIGTRKALGARSSYIRAQFIIESVIICAIGGVIGVLSGIGLSAVGVALLKMKLAISVPIIFISVGFSMLIGVFFGYYPAKKASQLDPIEALRYE